MVSKIKTDNMEKLKWKVGALLGVVLMGLLGQFSIQPSQAKAYEFWGKAQVIHCDKNLVVDQTHSMDISVNGKAVSAKSTLNNAYQVYFGTEVTCNGFVLTTCPGTNCQLLN
jgi:hypothetical protein